MAKKEQSNRALISAGKAGAITSLSTLGATEGWNQFWKPHVKRMNVPKSILMSPKYRAAFIAAFTAPVVAGTYYKVQREDNE